MKTLRKFAFILLIKGSFFFIVLLGMAWTGCVRDKLKLECPPFCDTIPVIDSLEFSWHQSLSNDNPPKSGISVLKPILYKDNVLFDFTQRHDDLGWVDPKIIAFNKITGEKVFTIAPNGLSAIARDYVLFEHYFIVNYFRNDESVICWDLESRSKFWAIADLYPTNPYKTERKLCHIEEQIYCLEKTDSIISLFNIDVWTGSKRDILSIHEADQGKLNIFDPVIEVNPSGDTILFFLSNMEIDLGNDEKQIPKLYKINIGNQEIEWSAINEDLSYPQSNAPLIYEDLIIMAGGNELLKAFDKINGNLIWQKSLNGPQSAKIYSTQPLLFGDKLYVRNNEKGLYCMNPNNGNVIWEGQYHGEEAGDFMSIYKGLLYYVCSDGVIYIVDSENGDILFTDPSPFSPNPQYLISSITIDKETEQFYFFDSKHGVAAKLAEKAN